MFQSTRIKLTAWYLLIIMIISIFFSVVIYASINQEFHKIEEFEKRRQREEKEGLLPAFQVFMKERQGRNAPQQNDIFIRRFDTQMIHEARMRIVLILGIVNSAIFLSSAGLGYFLAGRTLRPIQEMMDEQNRFVTDASHELRTPLTSLKTAIEVNLRNNNMTTAQAKAVLESNLEEVNNLQTLSDNLIHLSHYSHGAKQTFQKLHVLQLLNEAMKKIHTLASLKKITIQNNATDSQFVLGEKQLLIEVFVILLDNAIKYSPEKSVIALTVKTIDEKVLISVIDTGMGIAQKDIPHIFDRFYRADTSRTKNAIAGYGLGLAIAKHIVALHNGSLRVESVREKGSTFVVTLPKAS